MRSIPILSFGIWLCLLLSRVAARSDSWVIKPQTSSEVSPDLLPDLKPIPLLNARSSDSSSPSLDRRCNSSCSSCIKVLGTEGKRDLDARAKGRFSVWSPSDVGNDLSTFIVMLTRQSRQVPHDLANGEYFTTAIVEEFKTEQSLTGVMGLFGCMSAIIVSKKGTWVSHYWESAFSLNEWDPETNYWKLTDKDVTLREVVAPSWLGNSRTPGLKHLTQTIFAAETEPRVLVVSPNRVGTGNFAYEGKARQLMAFFQHHIPNSKVDLHIYARGGASDHEVLNGPYGKAIVQYDPTFESDCGEKMPNAKVWLEQRGYVEDFEGWEPYENQKVEQ